MLVAISSAAKKKREGMVWLLSRRTEPPGFLAGPGYCRIHVMPPSEVVKVRPAAVDTVAFCASVARTADRSAISGKFTRCQFWWSVERRMVTALPTMQQTSIEGPELAVSGPAATAGGAVHSAPHDGDTCAAAGARSATASCRLCGAGRAASFAAASSFRSAAGGGAAGGVAGASAD